MLSFQSYLLESSSEDKLKHLEHAEDHPINAGAEGFKHGFHTLEGVHNLLQGKHSKVSISTKYDGSPSVVFGHHPENKKFFVASKSAFNKDPKLNYSADDIEKNHGHAPGLVSKLKSALTHLPKVTPSKGVYQGDFMYSKGDKDVASKGDSYHFKPNTITYSAKKNSEHGKAIKNAKIGIVVHTAYHGKNLEDMKAEYNAGLGGFKHHSDVHVISPKYDTKTAHYTPEAQTAYEGHMKKAVAAHTKIKDYSHLEGHRDTIKPYINNSVKADETPSTEGYKKFLSGHHAKSMAAVKSPAAKERKQNAAAADMQHIEAHKTDFDNTFKLHHHLQKAKDVLNNVLSSSPQQFHHSIGGTLTKPEGHVAVIDNRPTKLVDRAEFSKANFMARPR